MFKLSDFDNGNEDMTKYEKYIRNTNVYIILVQGIREPKVLWDMMTDSEKVACGSYKRFSRYCKLIGISSVVVSGVFVALIAFVVSFFANIFL